MSKIAEMAEGIIATVKSYVDAAVKPLLARIEELQKSIPEPVQIDLEQIAKDAAALVPVPKDGEPGQDAPHVDTEALVAEVVKQFRQPEDGLPGKDADPLDPQIIIDEVVKQFRQPEDGKSVTVDDVRPMVEKAVGDALLDFERRAQDVLIKAIGNLPKPKDGDNGLGFDDLSVEYDGERGLTIKFSQGERVKEFPFTLPVVLDRGVFREGDDYQKGDGVTWGGSFFIAQKDNPEGKPGESDDYRLAVKRGRDGKNYEAPKPRPESVKLS